MTGDVSTIRAAISLLMTPSRVHILRDRELPKDIDVLLRVAARDSETLRNAVSSTERSASVIENAAEFYIEQILLAPNSDSYRILGGTHDAPISELRRNMTLLLRWLHPDIGGDATQAYASRVTKAWSDLKTPDRRAAYDLTLKPRSGTTGAKQKKGHARTEALRRSRHANSRRGNGATRAATGFWQRLRVLLGGSRS